MHSKWTSARLLLATRFFGSERPTAICWTDETSGTSDPCAGFEEDRLLITQAIYQISHGFGAVNGIPRPPEPEPAVIQFHW